MSVFGLYSRYYDLLYKEKDYLAETNYIDGLIKRFNPGAKTILDLGCGTGRHAKLFAERGYRVHGVDFSKDMLDKARENENKGGLRFTEGDIRSIRLGEQFDVVTALFHVISYQITNEDIMDSFKTANEHLNDGGIFIFDCWYGPAVLTERPEVRVKRLEDETIQVTRIAEPDMHANENVVDVNYQVYIYDKINKKHEVIHETHNMRYLFKPEVFHMLKLCGFDNTILYKFLSEEAAGFNSWNVLSVGSKNE